MQWMTVTAGDTQYKKQVCKNQFTIKKSKLVMHVYI